MRLWFFFVGLITPLFACPALSAELPIQKNYHNARVIFNSTGATEEYVLALGSYKKIAGSWRVDRPQRLSGTLSRLTLELPEGHSANSGFDFYLDQLRNLSFRELYYCKGRDCGTSNSWANNHFKIQQLYGLDQFQQYGAYEIITADDNPFYVSLYAVQRGNRRVYLQLDIVHVDKIIELGIASSPESIIKALYTNGYYVFPDLINEGKKGNIGIQIKPAHLQAVVDVLTQQSDWKIALVGHDYIGHSIAEQQKASLRYAEQLQSALVGAGVELDRTATHGIGGLAPAGRGNRTARVEIVKIQ